MYRLVIDGQVGSDGPERRNPRDSGGAKRGKRPSQTAPYVFPIDWDSAEGLGSILLGLVGFACFGAPDDCPLINQFFRNLNIYDAFIVSLSFEMKF